jgi:DNA-binding response OmpR family regulator
MPHPICRILIVDDDHQISSSIEGYLDAYGYQCESTRNAAEFKRKLKQLAPDICLGHLHCRPGFARC